MKNIVWVCLLMLCSCRLYTIDDYKMELLGKYYGADIRKLVLDYGIPSNTYQYGDITIVEYYKENTKYIPKYSTVSTYSYSDEIDINEYGGYYVKYSCKTIFNLKNGRVFDLKFEGNNCFHSYYVWK